MSSVAQLKLSQWSWAMPRREIFFLIMTAGLGNALYMGQGHGLELGRRRTNAVDIEKDLKNALDLEKALDLENAVDMGYIMVLESRPGIPMEKTPWTCYTSWYFLLLFFVP